MQMDIKAFVLGAASGALAFATVSWILKTNNENELTEEPNLEDKQTIVPNAGSVDSITDPLLDAASTNESGGANAEPERTLVPTYDRSIAYPDSGSAEDVHPVFESEKKDNSWSYYMEQAMLQFLADHPAIAQFEISSIDCRTTRCQVQVIGFDESTAPVWHQVMYDMYQQPWSEFGQHGNSSRVIDGRLVITETMHRK